MGVKSTSMFRLANLTPIYSGFALLAWRTGAAACSATPLGDIEATPPL
jgi:hypothetical protein